MDSNVTTLAQPFATKPSNGVKPESAIARILRDAQALLVNVANLDFFPATASSSRLDANYTKNPFGGSTLKTRIEEVGFRLNSRMVRFVGADAPATTALVEGFMNAFDNATVQFSIDGTCEMNGEHRLADYLAFDMEPVYVTATLAFVKITRRPLIKMPENIVINGGQGIQIAVKFYNATTLPAADSAKGAVGDDLKLVCELNVSQYGQGQTAVIADEIKNAIPAPPKPRVITGGGGATTS